MVSREQLSSYCQALRQAGRRSGHRYLLVVSGSRKWAEHILAPVINADSEPVVVLSSRAFAGRVESKHQRILGEEYGTLVVDGHSQFKVNGMLAAAGTLRSGGLLILVIPAWHDWPNLFHQQCLDAGLAAVMPRFAQRLCRQLLSDPRVIKIDAQSPLPPPPSVDTPWRQVLPSQEQQQCIAAICRVVSGRSHRPLVIRADRGRGKSAALGLAAARLLEQGCRDIVISAGRFDMVAVAFRHAQQSLSGARLVQRCLHWGECRLSFVPAAELITTVTEAELVMVDEAANLPLSLLTEFTEHFPRLVFSSTAQGYEGSGRGFDIRFSKILNERRPQWRRAGLNLPLRWAEDDPLEAILNSLFLLSNHGTASENAGDSERELSGSPVFRWVDIAALAEDEASLRRVFSLLVDAHYQTTPQDLQFLLDMPVRLLIAEISGRVVGVCQLVEEGGLSPELAADICRGRRRPKGHLAVQRLALFSGFSEYLICSSWRIHRIAVEVSLRRRGIGAEILRQVEVAAEGQVAFLSSSFAVEPAVQRFWRSAGFFTASLGSRLDTSSGSYSALVLRPLKPQWLKAALDDWQQLLADNLLANTPLLWPRMTVPVLSQLLAELPEMASDYDLLSCGRYARGEITFEIALSSLKRVCTGRSDIPDEFIARAFLHWLWPDIAVRFCYSGRGDIEAAFRQYFATLSAAKDSDHSQPTNT